MSSPVVPQPLLDRLLWPLRGLTYSPAGLQRLLARLGIAAPITALDVPALAFVADLSTAVNGVSAAVRQLQADPDASDAVTAVIDAVHAVDAAIGALSSARPEGFFDAAVLARMATDLPGLILAEAIAATGAPGTALRLLDVLRRERVPTTPNGPSWQQPAYRYQLAVDELPAALADPAGRVAGRWGWHPGQVRGDLMIADLVDLARLLGLRAHRAAIPDAAAALVPAAARWTRRAATLPLLSRFDEGETRLVETGLVIAPAGNGDGRDDGIYVGLLTDYAPPAEVAMSPDWILEPDLPAAYGLLVAPGSVELHDGSGGAGASLTLRATGERTLALPLASLAVPEIAATVTLTPDPAEFALRLATADGTTLSLLIDPTFGSAFLADLIGGPIQVDVPLDVSWTSGGGLRLGGGIGLSVQLPIGRQLGPIRLDSLTLGLGASDAGARLSATAVASAGLGPLVLSVDGLGVALDLGFGTSMLPGIATAVVAPAGMGIGLEVPDIASGGGYLFIDPAGTEYSGVLDLDLLKVGISAVGLLETVSADADGWSVFLALFLDLPSIPLGFGFTLNGVGGLVGFNRTLDVDALSAALRGGTLGAALFPADPVADAPQVVDSFRSMFPAAPGRTVFGPVVSIGWGSPTLIEAELGVVIALPDPVTVAVLGSVSALLPSPDAAVVVVHLDVTGVADLGAGTLAVDASLHDSTILGFALSGDMALRASFLGDPTFLFSLGGFHPGFEPPPGFPALNRLALALDGGDTLQIRLECYLALTSNTVQFGAALQLSALIEGFGIEGGADFDALVQLSPFGMRTDIGCHVSVVAAVDLTGVWFEGTLEGPNPWHVTGSASFTIVGIETPIHLDETIGAKRPEPPPQPADLLTAIRAALADGSAWSVLATPAREVVAAAATADGLVLEPDGQLQVSQKVAPLDLDLAHAGEQPGGDYTRFELAATSGLTSTGTVQDWFAPAYFLDIAPAEALAAPSFELLPSGLAFGGGPASAGPDRKVSRRYEEILRDPELGTPDSTGTFVPADDPRAALATPMTRSPAGIQVAANGAAPALARGRTSLVDRRTGTAIGTRSSWSAAHQSPAAAGADTILCPSWEVQA